jgi:hypothetical protein
LKSQARTRQEKEGLYVFEREGESRGLLLEAEADKWKVR